MRYAKEVHLRRLWLAPVFPRREDRILDFTPRPRACWVDAELVTSSAILHHKASAPHSSRTDRGNRLDVPEPDRPRRAPAYRRRPRPGARDHRGLRENPVLQDREG